MDLTTVRTIRNLPEKYHWYIIYYINKNHVWTSPHLTDFLPPYCNILYSNCFENLSQPHGPRTPYNQLTKNRQLEKLTSDRSEEYHLFTENRSKKVPRGLQFDHILDRSPMFQFSSWGLEEFRKIMRNKCVGMDSDRSETISDNGKENFQAQANRALHSKTISSKRAVEDEGASVNDLSEEISSFCEGISRSELCAAFMQWVISEHELEEIDDELPDDTVEIGVEIELQSDIDSYLRNLSVQNLNRRDCQTAGNCSQSKPAASECNGSADAADLEQLSHSSDNNSSFAEDWEESSYTDSNFSNETPSLRTSSCHDDLKRIIDPIPDNRLSLECSVKPKNREESGSMDCHVATCQPPSCYEQGQTLSNAQSRDSKGEGKVSQFIRRTGVSIKRKLSKIRNPFKRNIVLDDTYIV